MQGVEGQKAAARLRGVSLEGPTPSREPQILGIARLIEEAVSQLVLLATHDAGDGDAVRIEVLPEVAAVVCWQSASGDPLPERLFDLQKSPREAPEVVAVFLARWALESHGGRLELETKGAERRIRLVFPRVN